MNEHTPGPLLREKEHRIQVLGDQLDKELANSSNLREQLAAELATNVILVARYESLKKDFDAMKQERDYFAHLYESQNGARHEGFTTAEAQR